jgi:ABC-2 type transport system ATP-binding protein
MSATNALAIDVTHASKTYRGKVHALRDVSLKVAPGEIFGLLGPNGAGKSTLVKILMTVIRATRVEGRMLGEPIGHRPTLRRVGYLPEHLRFPSYLNGEQAIGYFGALSLVPRAERKRRAAELLDMVGMTNWTKQKIASYSKGMRQRLGLAVALIADPDIVVLDEPTDGVDPVGRKDIREMLLELRRRGKTVFVNSHLLGELEMVSDRVAIMSKGTVIRQGTLRELTEGSRRYEFVVESPGPGESELPRAELAGRGARITAIDPLEAGRERSPGSVLVEMPTVNPREVQPIFDLLRARGATIVSARPVSQSLEDLFMEAIRESGDATPGAVQGRASATPPIASADSARDGGKA